MKEILMQVLASPIMWGVFLVLMMAIVGIIVKTTKSAKDDAIFAMACKAFDIAEKIIPDEGMPAWMQKVDKALKVFREEYTVRYGTKPPANIIDVVKDEWSMLANALKKNI